MFMTYAIVETGGKQVRVEPGRFYDVEKLDVEVEETVILDQVMLVRHSGGTEVGKPLVAGASVQTRVLQHGKAKKILVYKMRPKKGYRRRKGHRQQYTRLMVEAINWNDQIFTLDGITAESAPEVMVPEPAIAE
jgi:large subunit ribosomal protein L21